MKTKQKATTTTKTLDSIATPVELLIVETSMRNMYIHLVKVKLRHITYYKISANAIALSSAEDSRTFDVKINI